MAGSFKCLVLVIWCRNVEEAAFGLSEDGAVSEPIQTDFGWHIIKRIEYKPVASFEESQSFIEAKVKRDTRSNRSKESFISKLKKEYGFKDYSAKLFDKYFYDAVDSSVFKGEWKAGSVEKGTKTLFVFAGKDYTLQDFADYIVEFQRKERAQNLRSYVDMKYDYYITNVITEYEDSQLENKYADFRALMREYRDGILLFEITDEMVWGKAQKDSVGLEKFHNDNQDAFMWDDRVIGEMYKCKDAETAAKVS